MKNSEQKDECLTSSGNIANAMLGVVLGIKHNKMTEQEKSILLSKYEKIKGYSSDLFDNEQWAEFDAFCDGYNLAKSEQS